MLLRGHDRVTEFTDIGIRRPHAHVHYEMGRRSVQGVDGENIVMSKRRRVLGRQNHRRLDIKN